MLSWLGNIFGSFLNIFKPLAQIAHWKIWQAIWDLIQRLRNWYKWYQQNVQKRMQAMRALYNHYFQQFVAPILKIVDTVRRLTGIVGLVNHKLAQHLNTLFERIEGYILLPFAKVIQRINTLQHMFGGFLTPLGYLDRATLLNSFWRDIGVLRGLLHDPFQAGNGTPGTANLPDFEKTFAPLKSYLQGQSSPLQTDVENDVQTFLSYLKGS